MGNSITTKLGMPLYAWNELNKLAKEINDTHKNFDLNIDDYKECTKHGKLYCDLQAVSLGAFELLRKPEFYK